MKTEQRGVAIVLAMGVVALAAMAATAVMVTQSTWARRIELGADYAQAETLIAVGVDWTRALLRADRQASRVDTLDEPWAQKLPPIPVENGSLAGFIEDQQGRFNLNNLVRDGQRDSVQLAHFQALLGILGLPPGLGESLAAQLQATASPLVDVAELALIPGFDDGVRLRLRPFVSVLPVFTPINVNTASAELIAAVVQDLELDAARSLVDKRQRVYLRDYTEFMNQLPRGARAAKEDIAFGSNYFLVQLRVSVGDAQARGSALLARTSADWPSIVWRKLS